jgi:hypothetical protein
MPKPAPSAADDPNPSAAEFLRRLIEKNGYPQKTIVAEMRRVVGEYKEREPKDGDQFTCVGASALSRLVSGKRAFTDRRIFNAVVLTALHLSWEGSARQGDPPGLAEVAKEWDALQSMIDGGGTVTPQQSEVAPATATAPRAAEDAGSAVSSTIDTEHAQIHSAYGAAGIDLLDAARSGDAQAASELGVLRTLDLHFSEGEKWLRKAQAGGSSRVARLLAEADLRERRIVAADVALASANLHARPALSAGTASARDLLLVEAAANAGHRKAAALLAKHFEHVGEAGSAERWQRLADRDE